MTVTDKIEIANWDEIKITKIGENYLDLNRRGRECEILRHNRAFRHETLHRSDAIGIIPMKSYGLNEFVFTAIKKLRTLASAPLGLASTH